MGKKYIPRPRVFARGDSLYLDLRIDKRRVRFALNLKDNIKNRIIAEELSTKFQRKILECKKAIKGGAK